MRFSVAKSFDWFTVLSVFFLIGWSEVYDSQLETTLSALRRNLFLPRGVCRTRVRLNGTLQRQRERYKTKDWLVCFLCTFLNRPRKNNDVKVMRFWRT